MSSYLSDQCKHGMLYRLYGCKECDKENFKKLEKSKPKKRRIQWFAKGGGIAKTGPFKTQIEATNAMRYGVAVPEPRNNRLYHPNERKLFPDDVFVWPEYV